MQGEAFDRGSSAALRGVRLRAGGPSVRAIHNADNHEYFAEVLGYAE